MDAELTPRPEEGTARGLGGGGPPHSPSILHKRVSLKWSFELTLFSESFTPLYICPAPSPPDTPLPMLVDGEGAAGRETAEVIGETLQKDEMKQGGIETGGKLKRKTD